MRRIALLVIPMLACAFGYGQTPARTVSSLCKIQQKFAMRAGAPADDEARRAAIRRMEDARAEHEQSPDDVEKIIWFGRRTAYLGNFCEAIAIYTDGLRKHPHEPKLLRHRGHRYITLRRFDLAIRDLERAARLIRGKPDEIEPDGIPNARNTPTSTLQSNIWYHLGLAYYLKGDFRNALRSYRECEKVSKNPDMLVATTHWLYMTLRRMNRVHEAAKALESVTDDIDIIENRDYHKLILMYQGKIEPKDLTAQVGASGSGLGFATSIYGIGNWYLYNSNKNQAAKLFAMVKSTTQWTSFGFVAAEVDLERLGLRVKE